MRKPSAPYRQILSLSVLAVIGFAGLLTPWRWTQILAVATVLAIVLVVSARNALRRASRKIDAILEEELGADTEEAPGHQRRSAA
jgi:membrane protein implicated in regulation of membrane protease activity